MAEDRVARTWVEVAASENDKVRISRTFVEVAFLPPVGTRATRTFVEVASSEPADPDPGPDVADDTIATVVFPSYEADGDPPSWVTLRGQDVRAYDHRALRTVWGPSHPFLAPDDCGLINGLIRCRFAGQGLVAFATVEAFKDDEWRDMGTLYFADPSSTTETVQRVRLVRLTPEIAIALVEVREAGPVLVSLRRGERMLRITHGVTLPPRDERARQVRWSGSPAAGVTNGRISGAPDAQDLIRSLATLDDDATQTSGGSFGLQLTAESFEVAAMVAVDGGVNDDEGDLHSQYAADCEQELRLR